MAGLAGVGKGYIDIDGAAAYLGTSVRHVRRLVYERELPHYKLGRLLRFKEAELEDYIAATRRGGAA